MAHDERRPSAARVIARSPTLIEENGDELAAARVARQRQAGQVRPHGRRRARRVAHLALLRRLADEDRGRRRPGLDAEHLRLHAARAGRRLRPDHPLELPAADGGVEDRPGARRRLHDRPQARRADAADRAAPRRARARGRASRAGVLNVVTGDGATGAALVDHPDVDKIAFTGSTAVGREIGAKAGRALKRVTLELGGKSPNIILPDADLEAAIGGAFTGIYFNSGQACNAASRLFVQKDAVRRGRRARSPSRRRRRSPARASTRRRSSARSSAPSSTSASAATSTPGKRRGRARRRRRHRPRRRRLLRRADAVHDERRRRDDRARGDLRPGARRPALRVARGGRRARQRQRVRPRRRRLDARRLQRPPARRAAARRHASTSTAGASSTPPRRSAASRPSGIGREHGREGLDAYLETKSVFVQL